MALEEPAPGVHPLALVGLAPAVASRPSGAETPGRGGLGDIARDDGAGSAIGASEPHGPRRGARPNRRARDRLPVCAPVAARAADCPPACVAGAARAVAAGPPRSTTLATGKPFSPCWTRSTGWRDG